MGLDIAAFEIATLTDPHDLTDACWDGDHVRAFVYEGFEQSLRGLEADRCYAVSGERVAFQAGSYGGYNQWRRALSRAALGVDPGTVWADPDAYRDRPFFELINFADNEGTIGPDAAADLAADFASAEVREQLAGGDFGWSETRFDLWARAFCIAAGKGLVRFR